MFLYLFNQISILFIYRDFLRFKKKQKHFVEKMLLPIIREATSSNDGTLDNDDFKRMKLYGLAVPAMLGEAYCALRCKPMSENERLAMTYLGSLTGLFDDLFDRKDLTDEYIYQLLEMKIGRDVLSSNEQVLTNVFQKVLELTGKDKIIKEAALKVYDAQVKSRLQKKGPLSNEEIRQITLDKGGVTIQMFRLVFDGEPDVIENELLYLLGGIGQLSNDIFDVYKDYHEGIQTLATTSKNIIELENYYVSVQKQIYKQIENTSFFPKRKLKFRLLSSLVMAIGLVGLNHLKKVVGQSLNDFDPAKYDRKSLICDMENPLNVFRLLHYAAKFGRK